MNPTRIDTISRLFAQRRLSRRHAVRHGVGAVAVGTLATARVVQTSSAQEATPNAPVASPAAEPEKTDFLFVQSFGAGSIAAGDGGNLTLTADHLTGQTLYFSDRPERIVGTVSTERFLGAGRDAAGTPEPGLGFTPADPPNAALVFDSAAGEDTPGDALVVELIDPTYDPATGQATYELRVLADETAVDLTLVAEPVSAAGAIRQFEGASLFIDNCPNGNLYCQNVSNQATYLIQSNSGFCYSWSKVCCAPCEGYEYWAQQCAGPDWVQECQGECTVTTDEGILACPND